MRVKKLLTVGAAALVATAGTLVAASPAQAVDCDHVWYTDESDSIGSVDQGGRLCFAEHGDYVFLTDYDADGYSVVLGVYMDGTGQLLYTLQASGAGDVQTANAGDGIAFHNLPEVNIRFRMYLTKSGSGPVGDVTHVVNNDH
ncbi:hypothetical protein [Streptomyces sp. NBC_01465]|uniref:hypothetical protein n=1 Tax=Streptomyces sp. NBC_01465 TaxID=2903878 RepID=UPI002E321F7B|nr:hypothetical protein [Streptomyces sp. NBC_01465]